MLIDDGIVGGQAVSGPLNREGWARESVRAGTISGSAEEIKRPSQP